MRDPIQLGPMPLGTKMSVLDEVVVRSSVDRIFEIARDVEKWPAHLPHYRFVRFNSKCSDGGGVVEMSANRQFGSLDWPTWWRSDMQVSDSEPVVRFRHVAGITKGMDVEWSFEATPAGTHVRVLHVWNGPKWPLIGEMAATVVIGPVFVHGIASRTLAGLARVAEAE
ncbi:MAG: SRPBCC family protein [Gemmatimonadota bacterium]|nr:SRPBCC family protein [Gemmatimonadota bacterium]